MLDETVTDALTDIACNYYKTGPKGKFHLQPGSSFCNTARNESSADKIPSQQISERKIAEICLSCQVLAILLMAHGLTVSDVPPEMSQK